VRLTEAVLTSGLPGVVRVAQRYRHTRAGQAAVAILDRLRGQPRPPAAPAPEWPLFRGDSGRRSVSARGDVPFLEPTWRHATLPEKGESREWLEARLREGLGNTLSGFVPIRAGG